MCCTIQVFDQPDLGGKFTVEADGTFTFPLIGRVKAGGLTLRGFERELKRAARRRLLPEPQVTVAVEQYRSQRVFVMGEVRQPGPVALTGGMTLIEALARAGSTLPTASGEVAIVRAAAGRGHGPGHAWPGIAAPRSSGRASAISRAGRCRRTSSCGMATRSSCRARSSVYVFGQVKNPGAYGIQKNTTVLQALSLAGGVTENGAMNRIQVIRIVNRIKKELKVKLTDRVRPEDTIIVPQRYF